MGSFRNLLAKFISAAFLCMVVPSVIAAPTSLVFFKSNLTEMLSQTTVQEVFQDSRGYIWVLTQEGLNRFDGKTNTIFRSDSSIPGTISNSVTRGIVEDLDGNIWIGTKEGGLNKFVRKNETFQSIMAGGSEPSKALYSNNIWSMSIGAGGAIWIGYAEGGFSAFHPASGIFKHYTEEAWPGVIGSSDVLAIKEDLDGRVLIATREDGLLSLDPVGEEMEVLAGSAGARFELPGGEIRDFHRDHNDNLWVSTEGNGVYLINERENSVSRISKVRYPLSIDQQELGLDKVNRIYQDREMNIFLATDYGVGLYHADTETVEIFTLSSTGLIDPKVTSLMQDSAGRYWIGTHLGVIVGSKSNFFTINAESGLVDETVFSITSSENGYLWVGTKGGLHRTRGSSDFGDIEFDSAPLFESYAISSLLADGDYIWVGTYANGIIKMHTSTLEYERFVHDPGDKTTISSDRVTTLYKDIQGNLWVGTFRGGLNRRAEGVPGFSRYRHDENAPRSLSNDTVWVIYQERSGDLWVGTNRGLNRYDYNTGTFNRFPLVKSLQGVEQSDVVHSLYEDGHSRLWIGREEAGLDVWEPYDRKASTPIFHNYLSNIEMPSSNVYAILGYFDQASPSEPETVDGLDNFEDIIWFSTAAGITRFNVDRSTYKHFTHKDGLQGRDFNLGAAYQDLAGKLYFGGTRGFNVFAPEDIADNSFSPPIKFTRLSVANEQQWFDVPYDEMETLSLEHTDYMVSFEFAALDYTDPTKNQYRYQMVGLNKSWVDLGNRNTVDFTNLPAGEYVFRVTGSNSDGVWNDDGVSLKLVVNPAWYASVYAFVFYFAVLLLFMLDWFRRSKAKEAEQLQYQAALESEVHSRTQDLKRANEQLQGAVNQIGMARQDAVEANQAKSEFMAALSHEIRTPMHGVLGMTDLLLHSGMSERQTDFAKSAHESATELLGLIDNILDFSKIEAGKLELEETTFNLRQVTENLCYLYGEMAQAKNIDLNLIFNANLSRQMYGDPVRLRQVLQNLLSNAIKFTSHGAVTVVVDEIERSDKSVVLRFSIEDTGIGMDESTVDRIFEPFAQADSSTTRQYGGTGLGLSIARQLINLMEGKLQVESRVGSGTRMSVELAMNESPIYTDKLATDAMEGYTAEVVSGSAEARAMFSSQLHVLSMKVRQCADVAELSVHSEQKRLVMLDSAILCSDINPLVRQIADDPLTIVMLVVALDLSGVPEELSDLPVTTKPLRSGTLVNDILQAIEPNKSATTMAMEAPVMRFDQKVLLVEDMVANQEIARAMLESFGCDVSIANNGDVALEMYQHTKFDIILMDCQMPVMDGFEATRHIRRAEAQKENNERIPVVAVTAGKTEVEKDRCYGAGMDRILFKPYSTAELNGVLAHYFEPEGMIESVVEEAPVSKAPASDILDLKAIDNIRSVEERSGNSLLAAVFENFKKDALLKIEVLRENTNNATELASASHAIASMSLNLGAKALAVYGRKLEADWKEGNIGDAAREIEVLHGHYLDAIKALEPLVQESLEQFA